MRKEEHKKKEKFRKDENAEKYKRQKKRNVENKKTRNGELGKVWKL